MYLTDYAENAYADKMRGVEPTLPSSWYFAFGTLASDSSFTEITHVSMPRVAYASTLAKWAGSQGAGTTLASSGTSHTTSNNDDIAWAAPSTDLGPATCIGLFDALSGGHCWAYQPIPSLPILNGVAPVILAGTLAFVWGRPGVSDYLSNKLIDEFFRGQLYPWPSSIYGALYTTAPTDAGGGVEVAAGDYDRVELESTLTALSGTHGAGTTDASSGTGGRISNNASLAYPDPITAWGDVLAQGWKDAATSGNLLLWGTLPTQSIQAGSPPPTIAPNKQGFTLA